MSEPTAEVSVPSGAPQTDGNLVNYSKQAMEIPKPPPAPPAGERGNYVDSGAKSRHARLQKLMADVGTEDDRQVNEKIRGAVGKDDELEAGAKAAEEADKPDTEEEPGEKPVIRSEKTEQQRLDDRRAKVEADEKAKLEAPEEEPQKAEATSEEDKAKAESDKKEKERREKFQKTLEMEAKVRKEHEKVRAHEARLVQREKELDNNIQRAQARYNDMVRQHQEEVTMARNILKLAETNPLELLERAGATPEDVAKWVAAAADPYTQELKRIRREMAERDRRDAESARRRAAAEAESQRKDQMRAIEQEFLTSFDEKDDKGDNVFDAALTIFSEAERLRIGHNLADQAYKNNYSFTHRDIAEAVNALAMEDERYKKIQARLSTVTKPAEPSKAESTAKPAAASSQVAQKPATPKPTTVLANSVTQQGTPQGPQKAGADYKRKREMRNRRLFADLDK